MSDHTVKYLLSEDAIPTHWINLLPDLPGDPLPPLHPGTLAAGGPGRPRADLPDGADRAGGLGRARDRDPGRGARDLPAVAPDAAVPRPAPRAGARRPRRTSTTSTRASRRPARTSPTRAVPQAYENAQAGIKQLATETGAGQWGSALAFACRCSASSARCSWSARRYDQKPYRRSMMETWGATVHRSPSDAHRGRPRAGRAPDRLAGHRDLRGGGGRGRSSEDTNYSLGSVLNHVLLHQTVIGQEAISADGAGRRRARRGHRLRRRRLELRRPGLPVPARACCAARRRRASWPPSPRPARR